MQVIAQLPGPTRYLEPGVELLLWDTKWSNAQGPGQAKGKASLIEFKKLKKLLAKACEVHLTVQSQALDYEAHYMEQQLSETILKARFQVVSTRL